MITRKAFAVLGLAVAALITLPVARASEADQATKLTFSQSVQIPGRVLPAGTYWFILADSISDRNIVRIFNSDRSTLYATILTIDVERLKPTDHTALTFAEKVSMPSNAIVNWFYPGNNSGHEFVYSKSERRELAQAKRQTIVAMAPVKGQTLVSQN